MRAIDGDALKKALVEHMDAFLDSDGRMMYSDHLLCGADYEDLCEFIDKQPTIQPEPHWIPVTERLPDENGAYLCQEKQGFLYVDTWNGEYWDCAERAYGTVIAWMPLPEPYKGVTT